MQDNSPSPTLLVDKLKRSSTSIQKPFTAISQAPLVRQAPTMAAKSVSPQLTTVVKTSSHITPFNADRSRSTIFQTTTVAGPINKAPTLTTISTPSAYIGGQIGGVGDLVPTNERLLPNGTRASYQNIRITVPTCSPVNSQLQGHSVNEVAVTQAVEMRHNSQSTGRNVPVTFHKQTYSKLVPFTSVPDTSGSSPVVVPSNMPPKVNSPSLAKTYSTSVVISMPTSTASYMPHKIVPSTGVSSENAVKPTVDVATLQPATKSTSLLSETLPSMATSPAIPDINANALTVAIPTTTTTAFSRRSEALPAQTISSGHLPDMSQHHPAYQCYPHASVSEHEHSRRKARKQTFQRSSGPSASNDSPSAVLVVVDPAVPQPTTANVDSTVAFQPKMECVSEGNEERLSDAKRIKLDVTEELCTEEVVPEVEIVEVKLEAEDTPVKTAQTDEFNVEELPDTEFVDAHGVRWLPKNVVHERPAISRLIRSHYQYRSWDPLQYHFRCASDVRAKEGRPKQLPDVMTKAEQRDVAGSLRPWRFQLTCDSINSILESSLQAIDRLQAFASQDASSQVADRFTECAENARSQYRQLSLSSLQALKERMADATLVVTSHLNESSSRSPGKATTPPRSQAGGTGSSRPPSGATQTSTGVAGRRTRAKTRRL